MGIPRTEWLTTSILLACSSTSQPPTPHGILCSRFLMLGLSAAVLVALVLPVLVLGLFVSRMPFDDGVGIAAGATGNPAILASSNRRAPTARPDVGYPMIFPAMTIVKVLFVDIVLSLL